VRLQLVAALLMEAFDGRLLDGAVHPLDLFVGPRVVRLCEPVLNVVCLADHVEAHLTRPGGVPVAGLLGELDAIVREDGVDAIRHGLQQVFKELPRRSPVGLVGQLRTANLLVRSMPTNRYSLPSAVCTSAISM